MDGLNNRMLQMQAFARLDAFLSALHSSLSSFYLRSRQCTPRRVPGWRSHALL